MKKYLICIFLALILLIVPASAKQIDNLSIDINEEKYAVIYKGEITGNSELVESLGYTTQSLVKYFTDNDLLVFATNSDKSRQIQAKCTETEFTRQLNDLTSLNNEKLIDIAGKILPSDVGRNYFIINKGDIIFYQFTLKNSDSGGEFCNRQYVTICDGKLYSIGFYESGERISAEFSTDIDGIMNALKIKREEKLTAKTAEDITVMVIIWVLIAAAAVLAGWMLASLMRDAFKKNDGEEERIIINRRKYKK